MPPVQQAANLLLNDAGLALQAIDITGYEFEDVFQILKCGTPVMLWITIDYGALRYCKDFSWIRTDTNESYLPIANLHCVLATFANEENVRIFDPIRGELELSYERCKYVYEQMGKRAIYIN